MEPWQIEALQALLQTNVTVVEEGSRVYVSSARYGESRYHLLDKRFDGIRISQEVIDEKWGSKVHLQDDEIPVVLKTLLTWHLEGVKKAQDSQSSSDDASDDLDRHLF